MGLSVTDAITPFASTQPTFSSGVRQRITATGMQRVAALPKNVRLIANSQKVSERKFDANTAAAVVNWESLVWRRNMASESPRFPES